MARRFGDPTDFLRQLEVQQPGPQYKPRPKYTPTELADLNRRERLSHRRQGQEWTNWRRYHCVEEAESPNRCMLWIPGWPDVDCTIFGTYVSYHTTKPTRLVLCSGHYSREIQKHELHPLNRDLESARET